MIQNRHFGLINYMVQLLETENNIKILNNLIPKIKNHNSKLILYNYDSFLFDFDYKNDGLEYLKKVKVILECGGKFPTTSTMGDNYHTMHFLLLLPCILTYYLYSLYYIRRIK